MTTPIGDAALTAVRENRSRRVRRTGPQPALPAPEPVRTEPSATDQEETVSTVSAALAAVQHQAAVLERDVAANPLAVVITARHVGRTFSHAESIAIADFIAAVEAEKRTQAVAAAVTAVNGSGTRQTGPQQVLA